MALTLDPFDPADYLETPEMLAEYLAAAFESGDPAVIADGVAIGLRIAVASAEPEGHAA